MIAGNVAAVLEHSPARFIKVVDTLGSFGIEAACTIGRERRA